MDIGKLSLRNLLGNDCVFEPDFCYADTHGSAEFIGMGDIVLFRKEGSQGVTAVKFRAIRKYRKRLFHVANQLMDDMGIGLRMGDTLGKIMKKFGTPDFIDYYEEDYENYYQWGGLNNFYDYHDEFYIVRYHDLLSPDLLVCFGVPRIDKYLTDLEIVNDREMVTGIMEARKAYKELDQSLYQSKEYVRFVNQKMKDRKFTGMQSKYFRLIKMELENCSIEKMESTDIQFRDCVFHNVTFDSHYETGYVSIKHCTFINCVFHDTFGDGSLEVKDSLFQNCLFEGIGMEQEDGILNANGNELIDCTFREIIWRGGGVFDWAQIKGGTMQQVYYKTDEISRSTFSDLQIDNMELEVDEIGFYENQLNTVIFRNVTLKGLVEDNQFQDCDTSGLRIDYE